MVSRASGLILALLTVACGGNPPPVVTPPPQPVRIVPLGLNDAFHGPLPPDIVAKYCGPITIRTPQLSGVALDTFLGSIIGCPSFHTLALVEGPDVALAADFARRRGLWGIELGNELELAPHNLSVQQYADFIGTASQAIQAWNPDLIIITGGVYTLDSDTKTRISAAHTACPTCWVGVHLYQDLSQSDLDWLGALPTQIAVTETGFPTRCDPARLQQQAEWLASRRALFSTVPNIALMVIYQRPNGADCSDLSTFGIDGKPADALLK